MLILIREMGKAVIPHSEIRSVSKHATVNCMVLSLSDRRVYVEGYHPELVLWHRNPDSTFTINAEFKEQL